MARTIKVHWLTADGLKVVEVDVKEARRLVENAHTRGTVAIDKGTGYVIDAVSPKVKEILLVGVLGGG